MSKKTQDNQTPDALAGREGQPLRLRFRLRRAAFYACEWRTQP